jgi:predicted MFS family arabinose efflux permease
MGGQYLGGKLTERLSPSTGLQVLFAVLGVLALAFVPVTALGLGAILAYSAVLGVALFAIQPFYQDAAAVYTPADTRGLSYGYVYVGEFGIGALSIVLGGFLLTGTALTPFFALLAAFAGAGALLSAGLYRYGRQG